MNEIYVSAHTKASMLVITVTCSQPVFKLQQWVLCEYGLSGSRYMYIFWNSNIQNLTKKKKTDAAAEVQILKSKED